MKAWIITAVLIIGILTSIMASFTYHTIRSPLNAEQKFAKQYVMENSEIISVHDIDFYHGTESFQVIKGKDADGEEWFVWYEADEGITMKRKKSDGLSIQEVKEFVESELNPQKINHIRLGIENTLPVYEISYIDEEDRYAYHYITFTDGAFVKRYSLRRE